MGTRNTLDPGTAKVYEAAAKWVECALRADDSLFTPGVPIWSSRWLGELHRRFLDRPDRSSRSFMAKLQDQLRDSPPEVYQLMGEALYFHYLIVHTKSIRGELSHINSVLGWSSEPVTVPPDLLSGLSPGIATPGQGFHGYRPFQVGYIIEFLEQWKEQDLGFRDALLRDPWAFKNFLTSIRLRRTLLRGRENTPLIQQQAILHLVFPDTFEAIVSTDHKERITDAFSDLVVEQTDDVDRKLEQIRHALESRYESTGNHLFYHVDDVRHRWIHEQSDDPWSKFVAQAKAVMDTGELESVEIEYKVEIGRKLGEARQAVLARADGWSDLLKGGLAPIQGHPLPWQQSDNFRKWSDHSPHETLKALEAIWALDESPASQRMQSFTSLFPRSVTSGVGTRTTVMSTLLMAVDIENYPPFRVNLFKDVYERTGYPQPEKDADEAVLYEHALGFLDRFIEEASVRGLDIPNRLYAQSVVWQMPGAVLEDIYGGGPAGGETDGGTSDPDLAALAQRTYLTEEFLNEIVELLEDKKQVIFQGPPGTGKTYVAQELAECLAGSTQRVTLVQFHPSYAYEDFVQGFRPSLVNGQAGFELREGPLKRAADNAKKESDKKHFLVIDEINRGNLAKVFGELYFLLEYRDREMSLQYSNEPFSLPQNLYIIGTMNTADRSIALVDLALRRRFHFVEFHPDEEPVKSVLNRFLKENASGLEWVADVVDKVNALLQKDRDAAIGPSYFMKDNLTEESVKRIWKHNILPYISELLHGQPERLKEFNLEALRAANTSVLGEANGATEQGAPHDGPSGSTG